MSTYSGEQSTRVVAETLVKSWERWKEEHPGGRARDAARDLGVSEGDLVAAQCGGPSIRLDGRWTELIGDLEPVGPLMGLTRNDGCVIEREGVYRNVHFHGSMGQLTGSDIDLRIFLRNWTHGFATRVSTPKGELESLQFFDSSGMAIHKIYRREATNGAEWDALIDRYSSADQSIGLGFASTSDASAARESSVPTEAVPRLATIVDSPQDEAAFLADWEGMKDTHEFVPLLRRYRLNRLSALRIAAGRYSRQVRLSSALEIFTEVSRQKRRCMVFVGNPGCLQIHSGPVDRVIDTRGWLNVMDPGFNLHLHRDQATEAFVVVKPTESGPVTSLEIFGGDVEPLVLLFSYRKGGEEEERWWAEHLATVPSA